jgi:hypothetical protein
MQIGYTSGSNRSALLTKRLLIMAGLVSLPIAWKAETAPRPEPAPLSTSRPVGPDVRALRLQRFLSKLHCPVANLAEDFVRAADDNHIDWRLLPSIAVIESGGGKAYKNNNIFGWNNGDEFFPTIRAGLHEVAFKLGKSSLYRKRDSLEKLRIYNPNESYAPQVLAVMARIGPRPDLPMQTAQIIQRNREFVYTD